ncbi:MAG: MATE family efflux transporter [Planctomycetaceae bacterium]|nr:MATE family efflux transporter [Planctomycetaceae bacterium]
MPETLDKRQVRRDFFRYALPSVAGMVISCLYTVVDGIFVGRGVGELALGGVNIVFPFIMLVIALTMLVSIGGANLASFHLGRNQPGVANNLFCQSVAYLLGIGVVLWAAAWFFPGPLCRLLGADDALLPYAQAYLQSMAPFVAVQTVALGLAVFVRNDGAPNLAMVGTITGAVANIALDYLFIMVWDWGIEGASIATGIGMVVELAVYGSHFLRQRGALRIRMPVFSLHEAGRLLYNGVSSFLMEFCQSAIAISFNLVIIRHLGAEGVAAYGVVTYICSSFNMTLIGITQGAQPILSFNHGRGDNRAVRHIYRLGSLTAVGTSCVLVAGCFLCGRQVSSLFSGEAGLVSLAADMLNYFCLAYVPVALTLMNILFFQTTKNEGRSLVISLLRCVGFVQVALFILPRWWGIEGVYWAFLCGEACNWLASAILFLALAEPTTAATPLATPALEPVYITTRVSSRLRAVSNRHSQRL